MKISERSRMIYTQYTAHFHFQTIIFRFQHNAPFSKSHALQLNVSPKVFIPQ